MRRRSFKAGRELIGRNMLQPTPSILFIHNFPARFVRQDMESLRRSYQVTEFYLPSHWINPLAVWRYVYAHDQVFGWFASWHTFLPMLFAKLLGKPSLLVIGGYDLAKLPEIGYGHQRGGSRKWVSRWTMRLSSCLATNSCYSQNEASVNARIPKDRVQVVYHGIPDPHGRLVEEPRERVALTVGNVDRCNLWRKGLEPFVRAAALVPDVTFVLVGAWRDDAINHLRSIATPNVQFTGCVDDEVLLEYYRRSSVYVQASQHEGFGMSLAEAMVAGCIPVVTREGALPEVVGECGVYCTSQEPTDVAQGVRAALDLSEDSRSRARMRILSHFSPERRRKTLEEMVECLSNGKQGGELQRGRHRSARHTQSPRLAHEVPRQYCSTASLSGTDGSRTPKASSPL